MLTPFPRKLPDPFTPPAVWERRALALARAGMVACHRCGHVSMDPTAAVPVDGPDGNVPGGGVSLCGNCGSIAALFPAVGATRELSAAEMARFKASGVLYERMREMHDNVVGRMIG